MFPDEIAKKAELERKKYREFTVTPGVTGFKVKIGCSEVYFSDARVLAAAINDYLSDPQRTEQDFLRTDIRLAVTPPSPGNTPENYAGQGILEQGGLRRY